MSILDTLITDRTGGHYGIEDLNRVGEAMMYVAERLRSCGLDVTVEPRTNWKIADMVTTAEAGRYLSDLRKIRTALTLFSTTPPVPNGVRPFNVQEANDIEKILLAVEDAVRRITATIDLGWALGIAHTGLYGGL